MAQVCQANPATLLTLPSRELLFVQVPTRSIIYSPALQTVISFNCTGVVGTTSNSCSRPPPVPAAPLEGWQDIYLTVYI